MRPININISITKDQRSNTNDSSITQPGSPKVSFFQRPISNTIPSAEKSLVEIYHLIKGDKYALRTQSLRCQSDTKEAKQYKAERFDYVTFSGVFSKRSDKSLIEHSGLLTIDFDDIEEIEELRIVLLEDPYFETEMLFVSPSGNGLKWIIPIDLATHTHKEWVIAVGNYMEHSYGIAIDGSGKDPSRACFLPHDPEVYINPKYL